VEQRGPRASVTEYCFWGKQKPYKARIGLKRAQGLAEALMGLLAPYVERIAETGELRRERPTIGTIELICVPKVAERSRLEEYLATPGLLELVDLQLLGRAGPYYQLIFRGRPVELFCVRQGANWVVSQWFRTGPMGWVDLLNRPVEYGGLLSVGMEFKGTNLYRDGGLVPVETERELFDRLRVPWVEPRDRTDELARSWQARGVHGATEADRPGWGADGGCPGGGDWVGGDPRLETADE
jgi:DNA polymerase/3'-5' exonuclease PolX